jgi:2'-5' RNA ligase
MKLFLVVRPNKDTLEAINKYFFNFRQKYTIFEWEPSDNILLPIAILGDYSVNKLPLIKEAIEQSIFDISPHILFFDQFKFLQKDGRLILLARFHKDKTLQMVRDRIAHHCSAEYENKIDEAYEPFMTLAQAKLPSKQQYLHLKKKIERMKPDYEVAVNKVELVELVDEPASSKYNVLDVFELAD